MVVKEQVSVAAECEMPLPTLPRDWHVLDGQPICPAHAITVKVDLVPDGIIRSKRKLNLNAVGCYACARGYCCEH